jgi:hypothetical protein
MKTFSRGKLNDADEGDLQFRIAVKDKTIIVDFGKPVVWIGLDKETAVSLANILLKRAKEI